MIRRTIHVGSMESPPVVPPRQGRTVGIYGRVCLSLASYTGYETGRPYAWPATLRSRFGLCTPLWFRFGSAQVMRRPAGHRPARLARERQVDILAPESKRLDA